VTIVCQSACMRLKMAAASSAICFLSRSRLDQLLLGPDIVPRHRSAMEEDHLILRAESQLAGVTGIREFDGKSHLGHGAEPGVPEPGAEHGPSTSRDTV